MSASEGQIKLLARITALEYLMQHVLLMAASSSENPRQEIEGYRQRVSDDLKTSTVSGVSPEMSDLLAQELDEAVDSIFSSLLAKLD